MKHKYVVLTWDDILNCKVVNDDLITIGRFGCEYHNLLFTYKDKIYSTRYELNNSIAHKGKSALSKEKLYTCLEEKI